jgi:hypothetical protein
VTERPLVRFCVDRDGVALGAGGVRTRYFRTNVQALGPAGKLGAEDAARLDAEAAAATGCIQSIGT